MLLKQWIHNIGRKNVSVNRQTHVCSEHFVQVSRRLLRLDEVASVRIPCSSKPKKSRKPHKYNYKLNFKQQHQSL